MPLPFREQERTTFSDVPLKWDVPFNTWLGVKFGQGVDMTLGNVVSKNVEESIWDNGDLMKPEVANRVFGIEGELKFDEPISIQKARLFRERKDSELRYRAYAELADHSWLSAKAGAGFAAGVLGSIAHPLDLGLGFALSPFKGAQATRAGMGAFRSAVNRGVGFISEETVQAFKYPGLSRALIEGTYGNLLFEAPVYFQARKEQADYTLIDSLVNIGAGGLFAGALHVGLRGIDSLRTRATPEPNIKEMKAALDHAAERFKNATPETKEAAFKTALDQTLRDEDIHLERVMALDERAIEAQVRFDEVEAIHRAKEAVGLESKDIEAAATEQLGRPRLEGLDAVNQAPFIKLEAPEGATAVRVSTADGKVSVQPIDRVNGENVLRGADIAKIEAGTIGKGNKFTPMGGDVKVTEAKAHKGGRLTSPEQHAQKVQQLTEARIKEYVESLRRDFEAQKPERVEALRQREIHRIQEEHIARVPADKKERLSKTATVDLREIEAAHAETAEIVRNLEREMSEEELAAFSEDLEAIKSQTPEKIDQAVDKGMPCIITASLNG